ncbi:hypothetical protein RND81_02G079000 [Saponaria officinalis]|uniref:Major facilitator superfamily (MFS) profile domain-containing protein n=1 Tax=Saponaria officinalis TaxID=3572 RepID=A0AAW1MRM7_SAPOF
MLKNFSGFSRRTSPENQPPFSMGTTVRRLLSGPVILTHGSQSEVEPMRTLRRSQSEPIIKMLEVECDEIRLELEESIESGVVFSDTRVRRLLSGPVKLTHGSKSEGTIVRRLLSGPVILTHGSQSEVETMRTLRRLQSEPIIKIPPNEVIETENVECDEILLKPKESIESGVIQVTEIEEVTAQEIRHSTQDATTLSPILQVEPTRTLRRSQNEPIILEPTYSPDETTENLEMKKTWWQMEISHQKYLSLFICFLCTLAVSYLNALPAQMMGLDDFLARLSRPLTGGKFHKSVNNYCVFYDITLLVVIATSSLAQPLAVLVTPPLCARVGRKKVLIGSLLWMIAGIVFIFWLPNNNILVLGLTILNFGMGLNARVIPMIQQEISQDKWPYLCDITSSVGGPICIVITYLISTNKWAWRFSFGGLGFFLLFILSLSFQLSESPVYLISSFIRKEKMTETFGKWFIKSEQMRKSSDASLLAPSNRPSLLISIFCKIAGMFSVVEVLQFYGPLLFKSNGKTTEDSYLPPILISIIQILFRLFTLITVKRYGRRRLLMTAMGIKLLSEVYFNCKPDKLKQI